MSRGLGVRQRQVVDALRRYADLASKLGVNRIEEGSWASVYFIAGEGASRSDVEAVRRALKRLSASGAVELSYQWMQRGRNQEAVLVARLSVEPSYRGTEPQHLDAIG